MADKPVHCSFCGVGNNEVEVMLAGAWPSFICDGCIESAREQVIRIRADRVAQAKLNAEAVRCTFCLPTPLQTGVNNALKRGSPHG